MVKQKTLCEIILKFAYWSRRRCRFKKLLTTDGQTDMYGQMDDGHNSITVDAKNEELFHKMKFSIFVVLTSNGK